MNENQQNKQYCKEEIYISDILIALWKNKIMIISVVLIIAIITAIFSFFIITPRYDSKLTIIISMPETYNTKYGDYKLPIATNSQYIYLVTSNDVLTNTIKDMGYNPQKVTVEKLRNRILIGKIGSQSDSKQNSFEVTVSADNSKESQKLAETLFDNYIEFMSVMTSKRVISYYHDKFSVDIKAKEIELKSEKEILQKNEELLSKTPKTVDLKEALNEVKNTKDYIVLENIINKNYTEVQKDIIKNKQNINKIEDTLRTNKESLQELDKENKVMEDYSKTGDLNDKESSLSGVIKTSIYLPSPPIEPLQKTSPRSLMNIAISLVLGAMLGVVIALIKEFWLKKEHS